MKTEVFDHITFQCGLALSLIIIFKDIPYFVKQDYKLRTIIVHFFPHLWLLMLDEGLKADIKEGVMILRKISYPQVTKFPKRNFYLPHTNIICRYILITYLTLLKITWLKWKKLISRWTFQKFIFPFSWFTTKIFIVKIIILKCMIFKLFLLKISFKCVFKKWKHSY